jgi:hypothetical protein
MDCLEALVANDALFANGWTGLGMALQAYAKRARPVAEWLVDLAARTTQADDPPREGRLLGYGDQGRAGRRL